MKKLKTHELHRLTLEDYKKSIKIPVTVVLDNIRSMHNVGSIFRTCDAFSIKKVILCGITPKPPHREINKTALGATESVDWEYVESVDDVVNILKSQSYLIIGLEQTDQTLLLEDFVLEIDSEIAVILGNEITGISDQIIEKLDICLEIPQYGTKHSLNVSVASGILLYHLCKIFK
jgi:23S rRNA (guanosine2251-2'-O)-methyltransferase